MIMTLNEVIKNNANIYTEVYEVKGNHGDKFHTDNLGDMLYDTDGNGSAWLNDILDREVIDYEVMDEDRYNWSVLANAVVCFKDIHQSEEEQKILVILVH